MASINNVEKTDYSAQKVSYTNKDYVNILDDLINSIPTITQKWASTDVNDPGMILVKLMAILGDMLFFNQDMQALEVYPSSVTQRKNAASIYKLIGYKMKWYRSATVEANIVNTYTNSATLPRFCTFTTEDGSITYTTFDKDYELPSNTQNNGKETLVTLVQGTPVTPVKVSSNPYPNIGEAWHSIYGYNYTAEDVINNRIYLKHTNIDQNHITIIDNTGESWTLKDSIYLTTDVGRFFEFNVDVNDQPYLELVDYWGNFNVKKFKIFYIRSAGENGEIFGNTLKKISGNVWSRVGATGIQSVYNVSGFIKFTHFESEYGYNPETPDEARKNAIMYQNTLDTLITLADFEKATLRQEGVANVRATDLTNDPGIKHYYYLGDVNHDGSIDEKDILKIQEYLADKENKPLTELELELADVNKDGVVDENDIACIQNFLDGKTEGIGKTGVETRLHIETLDGFIVKLYVLPTEEKDSPDIPVQQDFASQIISALRDYKALPLNVEVDFNSIQKYYWSVSGKFYTTQPLSRDELQTIMVNINNTLRHTFARDKINFNTGVNYRELIDIILGVDNRILMVDLDPISYVNAMGEPATREQITGNYSLTVPLLTNEDVAQNLHYIFKLPEVSILPGSLLIRVNNGQYTLRDNNNGEIYNVENVLQKKGKINYVTGEVDLLFVAPQESEIIVNYTSNVTTVSLYRNLSTQEFYFDASSLKADEVQDVIK